MLVALLSQDIGFSGNAKHLDTEISMGPRLHGPGDTKWRANLTDTPRSRTWDDWQEMVYVKFDSPPTHPPDQRRSMLPVQNAVATNKSL